ncbi:single-stranded DNA-binding protein [uncultured Brevundimonas sp.]|uniref:single-stranded DNA-binding protein n=1 Tax=uncultured Brevundimonas sp. TaxID=213418 RepID=UPI002632B935|nr:single-stranded DNA-binding protein [uncultured Brevundimonas sp.]
MSGSVNKTILVGRLTKDPEIRTLNSGDRVASLRVVTSETWRDKQSGEKKEKAEFHSVVVFNENIVKVCENYLKKGSTVYVEGSLQTRKYTDAQGIEKYSTEIVLQRFNGTLTMLGGGERSGDGFSGSRDGGMAGGGGGGSDPQSEWGGSGAGSFDDSIPF